MPTKMKEKCNAVTMTLYTSACHFGHTLQIKIQPTKKNYYNKLCSRRTTKKKLLLYFFFFVR